MAQRGHGKRIRPRWRPHVPGPQRQLDERTLHRNHGSRLAQNAGDIPATFRRRGVMSPRRAGLGRRKSSGESGMPRGLERNGLGIVRYGGYFHNAVDDVGWEGEATE